MVLSYDDSHPNFAMASRFVGLLNRHLDKVLVTTSKLPNDMTVTQYVVNDDVWVVLTMADTIISITIIDTNKEELS